MRKVLSFAVLFLCAGAVQAQEPVAQEPIEPVPASMTAVELAEPAAPVFDMKTQTRTDAAGLSELRLRAPAPADAGVDAAMVQDIPRNFWWLVGGIVLAGIILAVIL